jgi:hypothetical protein
MERLREEEKLIYRSATEIVTKPEGYHEADLLSSARVGTGRVRRLLSKHSDVNGSASGAAS